MGPAGRLRPRTDNDAAGLVALAEVVHAVDGYPPVLPGDDFRSFLFGYPALAAWVADVDGVVAGHVALHARSSDVVMRCASDALRCPEDTLGVVARLFVGPAARGRGVGAALLDAAEADARDLGKVAILDVNLAYPGAIALYDRCGWRRLGKVTVSVRGVTFDEYVYASPAVPNGR